MATLDNDTKKQLSEIFSKLTHDVSLRVRPSSHPDQNDLIEMLNEVSTTSVRIQVQFLEEISEVPSFEVWTPERFTGVSFRGIPGGHEFSSLVLSILNADQKGKLPDEALTKRIRAIPGPIRLKTYISLTCENCPDVVQALNLMATLHEDFHHEMVDGSYAQDEVNALGIQGVPSVVHNKKLIHSGKSQLLDLIEKLETQFGKKTLGDANQDLGFFDVAVIGAGPAGASAAIYSVRKGLRTALVGERFGGQVQETKGIENLIGTIYTEGPQLAAQLSQHVQSYPVKIFEHRRVQDVEVTPEGKRIIFESGERLTAKALIIATGAKWRELGVPGEKEYLGRGVAFCPHCDGPYYKGKKVAVVGGGNSGVEAAIDLAGIVSEVVLIEFQDHLKADQVLVDKLKSLSNVSILTGVKTDSIQGDGSKVNSMILERRATGEKSELKLDGVFVQIGLVPNSQFVKGKVETTKFGEIVVDNRGRTTVKGIYAAGDVTTTPYKQIIISMGEGAKVALTAFEDQMLAPV